MILNTAPLFIFVNTVLTLELWKYRIGDKILVLWMLPLAKRLLIENCLWESINPEVLRNMKFGTVTPLPHLDPPPTCVSWVLRVGGLDRLEEGETGGGTGGEGEL